LRARKNGFKFNPNKCHISVKEITYLGNVFSSEGVKIDQSKVEAIVKMPTPQCKKDLERFLGMTNYVSKFIPGYSNKTDPLRELLKKENVWYWDENLEKSFQCLKNVLCESPVLGYFDNTKPVTLSVDASSVGLGAAILQDNKPIAYASRALTQTQRGYAQIEKEMLAITFGCEKFHPYLYSRPVIVETDHKPLESIFKKPLFKVPMRLQRMLLKVQPYHLMVKYKQGKLMYVADTLSRATVVQSHDDFDDDIDCFVNMLVCNLPLSDVQMNRFVLETKNDDVLGKLTFYAKHGWPLFKSEVEECVKPFWNYRDEINVAKGLVFKSDKIVIPLTLQSEMLKRIHEGHLGIERCKQRAREVMFWPGMSSQIGDLVSSCITCKKFQRANTKEPLMSYDVPALPWEHVGSDLYEYKSDTYVIVTDYFSNFIEVCKLPDLKSLTVIAHLKSIFARHGIPKRLTSNNGKQYCSAEFVKFCNEWEIEHCRSSPLYPKSNGLVESSVKKVKKILAKCEESGDDPYLAMLNLRNTPRGELPSPAEMLMSRKLNCRLPITTKMLKPKCVHPTIRLKLEKSKVKSKYYHDQHCKSLPKLKNDQSIVFKKMPDAKCWMPGTVKSHVNSPRSYIVEDSNGNCYRRNRSHIIHVSPSTSKTDSCSPSTSKTDACSAPSSRKSVTSSHSSTPITSNVDACSPNKASCSESKFMERLNSYVTRHGRQVKNPKRLSFS